MEPRNFKDLPKEVRPISAWGYFWYNILFCIPIVGLICLITFSFSDKNLNRRNYARSFFIAIIVALIAVVVWFVAVFCLVMMYPEFFGYAL